MKRAMEQKGATTRKPTKKTVNSKTAMPDEYKIEFMIAKSLKDGQIIIVYPDKMAAAQGSAYVGAPYSKAMFGVLTSESEPPSGDLEQQSSHETKESQDGKG